MPTVSFSSLRLGGKYSRRELADLWNYNGIQGLSRGVVTPSGTSYVILFVTREKQDSYEQYDDELRGKHLHWEGPVDHYAEERMSAADSTSDEIHLFYRDRHHADFIYHGQLRLKEVTIHSDRPSQFVFTLVN